MLPIAKNILFELIWRSRETHFGWNAKEYLTLKGTEHWLLSVAFMSWLDFESCSLMSKDKMWRLVELLQEKKKKSNTTTLCYKLPKEKSQGHRSCTGCSGWRKACRAFPNCLPIVTVHRSASMWCTAYVCCNCRSQLDRFSLFWW